MKKEAYLLTFDLGTTGNKVAVWETNGRVVDSQTVPYPVQTLRPGWVQQRPIDLWQSCVEACRALTERGKFDPNDLAAIGLSGTMNGMIAVDESGAPVFPSIIHSDTRSGQQAERQLDLMGMRDWYELTGSRPSARFSLTKVMWLRDNHPDLYNRTAWVIQTKDFIRGKLTGVWGVTDPSDASLSGMLNVLGRHWAKDALRDLDVDPAILPEILPSYAIAGTLGYTPARLLGLPEGIPVAVGGGDGACAARGAGLTEPGQLYACIGSSAWISQMSDDLMDREGLRLMNYYDLDGEHLVPTGTVQAAATSLDFAVRMLGLQSVREAKELARSSPAGSLGLLYAPYLQGERAPMWDDDIRGAFLGLDIRHTPAHVARAVYEGVSYALDTVLDIFRQECGQPARMTVLGGGAQSDFWIRMLADVLDCPLQVHRQPRMGTSLGAAMTAGVASGVFATWEEAAGMAGVRLEVFPMGEPAYDAMRALFARVYPALCEVRGAGLV